MRVSTLIASDDRAYTEHIAEYISEHHADTMEVSVCNSIPQLHKALAEKRYNAALLDEGYAQEADLSAVDMPLILWTSCTTGSIPSSASYITKYKRISLTVAAILEQLAAVSGTVHITGTAEGNITAVWSPCGGAGKTTVALAYAMSKAEAEKKVFYLNLEHFAATPAYFDAQGKSISEVFEMLDGTGGNIKMLIQGIHGSESGIDYLCAPDNYEDICILTGENVRELIKCCAGITDELVIDMPGVCDERARQVFELAGKVLLVTDTTQTAGVKMSQFMSQSNVYEKIKEKTVLVVNKNPSAAGEGSAAYMEPGYPVTELRLPLVQAGDERYIYKTLARSIS